MTEQASGNVEDAIIVERRNSLAIIRFNQPTHRNSLSIQTLEALDKTVSALTQDDETATLIFTGTEDVFASGANIAELAGLTSETAKTFAELGQFVFGKIANAEQTTIAAINGYCIGGGLDLALACDIRCASVSAVFAHPGARLGIITGWGGTQRLPRLIGTSRALDMFTTARRLTCIEAYEIGLVTRIGDPVLDCALELVS